MSYWRTTLDGLTGELLIDLLERWLIDHLSLELTKRIAIGIPTGKNSDTEPRWLAITLYSNIISDWRVCTVADLLRYYEWSSFWELDDITLMKCEGGITYTYSIQLLYAYWLWCAAFLISARKDRHL